MSKVKYWCFTCDYCGQSDYHGDEQQAMEAGWKKRGKAHFCSTACWKQSKEHSLPKRRAE